jgi:hypothetical protein
MSFVGFVGMCCHYKLPTKQPKIHILIFCVMPTYDTGTYNICYIFQEAKFIGFTYLQLAKR